MRVNQPVLKSATLLVVTMALAPGMLADTIHRQSQAAKSALVQAKADNPRPAHGSRNGLLNVSVAPLVLDDLPASAFGDRATDAGAR